jgi:hypothetical protein
MANNREQLEQLLICIGAKCDLHEMIAHDPRFAVRLQQTIRGCLGTTTSDAESFMASVFGRDSIKACREARRQTDRPIYSSARTMRVAVSGSTSNH